MPLVPDGKQVTQFFVNYEIGMAYILQNFHI